MHFFKQLLAVAAIAVSTMANAEPGISDTKITIGMSGPFSGTNGAYGVDMRTVIQTWVRSSFQPHSVRRPGWKERSGFCPIYMSKTD